MPPVGAVPTGYVEHDLERLHYGDDPDDYRSRFGRDYDRLVHTSAFRRLQGKTQVVSPGEADFFRTRLTHSIEVAQVARRLAEKLGANPDLCEASAILHDLGHPPFGHVGEDELNTAIDLTAQEWRLNVVDDVGGFNGNAQSFRLAVKTLTQSSVFDGLDLTRSVLDGAVKYPYRQREPGVPAATESWCFYPTERQDAEWVRERVPPARQYTKSFEAQIVDWADDVAYSIHDVEDWYRAGFMPLEMLAQSEIFRDEFARDVAAEIRGTNFPQAQIEEEIKTLFGSQIFAGIRRAYDGSTEVKEGIRTMRKGLFNEFTEVRVADEAALATRHNNDLVVDERTALRNKILKRLLWVFVIDHPRMATHQMGQARIVRELFDLHVEALAYDPARGEVDLKKANLAVFPRDLRERLQDPNVPSPERLRLVTDRVSGMTDEYAIRLHGRLTGSAPDAFNAFV